MTQDQPSVILYSQAMTMITALNNAHKAGLLQTSDSLALQLRDILNKYRQAAGRPMLVFDTVEEYEPPVSIKMNRLWQTLRSDISILQQETDILRAGSVSLFNTLQVETAQAKNENAELMNKIKVLQLYSDSSDPNIVVFGDEFNSDNFIDHDINSIGEQAFVVGGQYLSLTPKGDLVNVSTTAGIKILDSSNGIAGNNQELNDPSLAIVNPQTQEKYYSFVGENNNSNNLLSLLDDNPDSWFEYESYLVSKADRNLAKNFNFTYSIGNFSNDLESEYDWANGPVVSSVKYLGGLIAFENRILKLGLEITLSELSVINRISLKTYGLTNNINHPIQVKYIEVSSDGVQWDKLRLNSVWIASQANLDSTRIGSDLGNISIGDAIWSFDSMSVKFIKIYIEQPRELDGINIGHLHYVDNSSTARPITINDDSIVSGGETESVSRLEGPIPPITNPMRYHDPRSFVVKNLLQKRELFKGKRWVIGLRDINIEQVNYVLESSMVTKPLRVNGIVDRVTLSADVEIPESFDTSKNWVEFYVSPNDGLSWFQISRIQDDTYGIPEVIAFNDPTPEAFRDRFTSYETVSTSVTALRLKIVLKRPQDTPTATPIVRSFRLKVRKQ